MAGEYLKKSQKRPFPSKQSEARPSAVSGAQGVMGTVSTMATRPGPPRQGSTGTDGQ